MSVILEAAGIPDSIELVTEAANNTGLTLDFISRVFAKVAVADRLTHDTLLQLASYEVPAHVWLAETLGVEDGELESMVGRGEINYRMFETAMRRTEPRGE